MPGDERQDGVNRLTRVIQRWRNRTRGDIIAANVEAGAENVAVGKNIWQINVGGRNLLLPILSTTAAALAIVGYLVYPSVEGIWNPSTMFGDFNIAVADFGIIDETGNVHRTNFASSLSQSVFDQLQHEYEQFPTLAGSASGTADTMADGNVWLWHDSLGRSAKNVRFGVIEGSNDQERADNAAKLADRIGADMVVYGNLRSADDPESLEIDFYFRSETILNEFDSIVGNHRFGPGIPLPISADADESMAKLSIRDPLAKRTSGLFWLTVGLTYDAVANYTKALDLLLQAQQRLVSSGDDAQIETLYYLIGRTALRLRQYDTSIAALEEAIRIRPGYTNAMITLGGVYLDRAQLFFIRGQEIPEDLQDCLSTEHDELAVTTLEEAMADIHRSVRLMEQAVVIAQDDPWPPIQNVARLALGLAYRLQGQAFIFAQDVAAADTTLSKAQRVLEENIGPTTAQSAFEQLGWTRAGLGATAQLQAHLRVVDMTIASNGGDAQLAALKAREAGALLTTSIENYQMCIDVREKTQTNLYFTKFVLECSCIPYQEVARTTLQSLGQLQ